MSIRIDLSQSEWEQRCLSLAQVGDELDELDRREDAEKKRHSKAVSFLRDSRMTLLTRKRKLQYAVTNRYEFRGEQADLLDTEREVVDPPAPTNGNGTLSSEEAVKTFFDATKAAIDEHLSKEQEGQLACLCLHAKSRHAENGACLASDCCCEWFTPSQSLYLPAAPPVIEAELIEAEQAEADAQAIPDNLSPRDIALWHALHWQEGAAERWAALRLKAVDDASLMKAIAREFGEDDGFEVAGVKLAFARGGVCKFWFGKTEPKGKPTLQGAALLAAVRTLLNLPKAKTRKGVK